MVNIRDKGGKIGLRKLLQNLEQHTFYDNHKDCTDGCPRRFRDIILGATSSLFQAAADIGTMHKGDIIQSISCTSSLPYVPFDIITTSHHPESVYKEFKFSVGTYTYNTIFHAPDTINAHEDEDVPLQISTESGIFAKTIHILCSIFAKKPLRIQ